MNFILNLSSHLNWLYLDPIRQFYLYLYCFPFPLCFLPSLFRKCFLCIKLQHAKLGRNNITIYHVGCCKSLTRAPSPSRVQILIQTPSFLTDKHSTSGLLVCDVCIWYLPLLHLEDVESKVLRNVAILPQDYTISQLRTKWLETSSPWKPQFSQLTSKWSLCALSYCLDNICFNGYYHRYTLFSAINLKNSLPDTEYLHASICLFIFRKFSFSYFIKIMFQTTIYQVV
jgi:hypothetical protein